MNRHISKDQLINAFKLLSKYKLQTIALNIIGLPGETEEMIWDTIKLNRMLRPTSSVANIFYPYKGTQLGDSCFKRGLVNEELYSNFSNERRSSVLNYPEEYKQRLIYIKEHWQSFIYQCDFIHRFKSAIKLFLAHIYVLEILIKLKRSFLAYRYKKRRLKETQNLQE